jgi:hypothetical protein
VVVEVVVELEVTVVACPTIAEAWNTGSVVEVEVTVVVGCGSSNGSTTAGGAQG